MPEIIINYRTSLYDSFCVQWLIYWLGITEMIKTLIVSLMDLCLILIFEIMISSFINFYSIIDYFGKLKYRVQSYYQWDVWWDNVTFYGFDAG